MGGEKRTKSVITKGTTVLRNKGLFWGFRIF
jgi:hypothetical protein